MYLGHYYTWKGTDILLKAAEKLDNNIELVLAGGTDLLDKEIINNLSNIKLVNTKKRDMVAKYLKSADILIITANKNSKESIKYTSPIKLFEYLASKVPVLAPEVESMTNIVTNKEVTFYEVDNVEDLVNKINNILIKNNDKEIENGYEFVKKFTWENRVKKILDIIHV